MVVNEELEVATKDKADAMADDHNARQAVLRSLDEMPGGASSASGPGRFWASDAGPSAGGTHGPGDGGHFGHIPDDSQRASLGDRYFMLCVASLSYRLMLMASLHSTAIVHGSCSWFV